MVAPRSFLPDGVVTLIQGYQGQGFATRLKLRPTLIRLYRDDESLGDSVTVVIDLADRQSRDDTRDGVIGMALSGGTLTAWAPLDIRRGDTFRYGNATATVGDVPPVSHGIQTAGFVFADGGGA